ncbi:unnamed protein product [Dicrocoelium dendriticum]|nr:unnamed protein product [Dicrocoelium dendriticum]
MDERHGISSVSTIRRPSPLTSCIPSQGDLAQNISVSSSRSFGASASSRPAPLSAPDANMPTISSIAYIPPSHLPSVPSSVIPSLTPIFVSGMLPGHAISHQSESNVGALLPSLVDSVNVPASSGVLGVLNPSGYTSTPSLVRPLPPSVMQRPGAFSQILAPNTISHGFVPPTAPFLPHVFNGTAAPPGSTSLVSIAPRFPPRHENVAPRPSFHLNTVSSLPQISTQSKGHGNESHLHISPTSAFSETPLTSVVPPSSSDYRVDTKDAHQQWVSNWLFGSPLDCPSDSNGLP